jgi:nicotinic acid mononucleotide adenylyltransferase
MPKDLIVKAIKPMTFTYKKGEDYFFDILGKGFNPEKDKVELTVKKKSYALTIDRAESSSTMIRAKFTPGEDITLLIAEPIITSGEIEITVTNEEESDGGMYP